MYCSTSVVMDQQAGDTVRLPISNLPQCHVAPLLQGDFAEALLTKFIKPHVCELLLLTEVGKYDSQQAIFRHVSHGVVGSTSQSSLRLENTPLSRLDTGRRLSNLTGRIQLG
jgi:hypothetical protein